MPRPSDTGAPRVDGHRVGRLVGSDERGPLVELADGQRALPARVTQTVDAASLLRAVTLRQDALLVFDDGQHDRPIVVALLAPAGPVAQTKSEELAPKLEALVDGGQVTIEGRNEIVLRCGDASITLRRNGRVVVRRTYVETRSEGANRIKGGSVKIN